MQYKYSNKAKDMKPSAIREMFKYMSDPRMISFSAGNPSPKSFPVEKLKAISDEIFETTADFALQYGITEGYNPLREQVADRLKSKFNAYNSELDDVVIVSGGQQGIDLTAKALCNEGDVILCENPSFIGALNSFRAYNTKLVGIDLQDDGIDVEMLEKVLKTTENVKLLYIIPTFQNPAGSTTSFEKRKKVYELCKQYSVVILEDNPYGELRFDGKEVPTIKSLDTDGIVVYCGSFSKVLSAGMRVGFLSGPKELIQKIVVLKQVNDVHTNLFFQILTSKFIEKYGLDDHVAFVSKLYKDKAHLMVSCIEKYFPANVKFTRPEGGLFLWVTLPESFDADVFAKTCLENYVAIVSGTTFDPQLGRKSRSFRLNYSTPSDEQIEKGIKTIGELIKERM